MTPTATAAMALGGALVGFAVSAILIVYAAHDEVDGRARKAAWYLVIDWRAVLAILALFTLGGAVLAVGLDGVLELAGWWP